MDMPMNNPMAHVAEWSEVYAMLDDVSRFAKENPDHQFLWSDNIQASTYGIVAFLPALPHEQCQAWTISSTAVRNSPVFGTLLGGALVRNWRCRGKTLDFGRCRSYG
jgi:hypothetical protein